MAVGGDTEKPGEKLAIVAKANMADKLSIPALRFRTEGVDLPHPEGGDPIKTARVVWMGEEIGVSADVLMPGRADSGDRSELDRAKDFLRDHLRNADRLSNDLFDDALNGHDISRITLRRAKKEVGVEAYQKDRRWWWTLGAGVQALTQERELLTSSEVVQELFPNGDGAAAPASPAGRHRSHT
ncbi:hypothetical protein BH24ACT5_BH24ACT5_00330 [soil metagenome]